MVFGRVKAVTPPPGVTPNFANPETNVLTTNVVGTIFTTITIILVMMRIYTRSRLTKSLGWDDCKFSFC